MVFRSAVLILSVLLVITPAQADKIPKIEYGIVESFQSAAQGGSKIPVVVVYMNGSLVKKKLSVLEILQLASDPDVSYIRRPRIAHPLSVGSLVNFTQFHTSGITGEGVKIAVIDLGFKYYKSFLNPDRIVEVKSFRMDGETESTIHGTLCASVISSIAPDAELYLLAVESDVDFIDAVEYAISRGVDIISISLGWVAAPFDGSGYLCEAVNKARKAGILVVVSAGNYANKHYEGTFSDPDNDGWHNFAGMDEILNIGELKAGTELELVLSWDDWPGSANDYDLYLLYRDTSGWKIYSSSESPQTGYEEPVEIIYETIPFDATWGVAIKKDVNAKPLHIELYSTIELSEYVVPNSSISTPADADGAISVGALKLSELEIYNFSSRGPTNDGRLKPDFVSVGWTNIRGYSFMGTSVSAPHIAGLAALIKSMRPSLSAEEVIDILRSCAVDLGQSGKDNVYGYGIPNASEVYYRLSAERIGISIIAPRTAGSEFVAYVSFEGGGKIKSFFYNLSFDPSCVDVHLEPIMNFDIYLTKEGEGFLTFMAASKNGISVQDPVIISKLRVNATCSDSVFLEITNAEHDGVPFDFAESRSVRVESDFDFGNETAFLEAFDLNENNFVDPNELALLEDNLLIDGVVGDSELVAIIGHWLNGLLSDESLVSIIMLWLQS